jgi:NADPH:quinone reductase-like Zn-dependent oxidoreductase
MLTYSRSGYRPIATSSPANFDLVRKNGAEEVFDYRAPDVAERIKAYTKNTLRYVLDIITEVKSMKHCYAAIGRAGGRYTCLEKYHEQLHTRKTVKPELVMGITILGKRIALDHGYGSEANPELREFGVGWYQIVQQLIDQGKIRPHPIRVYPGRWEGILEGLELLRNRKISAQKLVVLIEED